MLTAITNASAFLTASVDPDTQQAIRLVDTSIGAGTLSVSGLPGSFVALDLGLVGTDVDGDGVLVGQALHGVTDADRFFIDAAGSMLGGNISLSAADVDATARVGFVDVSINSGTGTASAGVSVSLTDPGTGAADGRITFDELFDALANDPGSLIDVQGPTGSASFELPIEVNPAPLSPPGDPRLIVTISDLFDPGTFAAAIEPEFDLLSGLEEFAFSQLINGLREVQSFLTGVEANELLQKELPLVNTSLAEVLELSARFGRIIDRLEADQPRTIAAFHDSLEGAIQAEIGELSLPTLNIDVGLGTGSFDIDVTFGGGVSTNLPLSFDLISLGGAADNLISIETGGELTLTANAQLTLGLTIDVSDPTSPEFYVKDTTGITASATVTGEDLSFDATVLVFTLLVRDGTANLNGNWTLGLVDDPTDHRYELFDELTSGDIDSSLTGMAMATLPVFFGNDQTPFDPTTPAIVLTADLETLLEGGTISLVVPDFAARIDALIGDLQDNLDGLVGSWDGVFKLLEDLVDGNVLGVPVPLIGDQLAQAASFLTELRTEVTAAIDGIGTQGVQPLLDAFFEVLGPISGLNLLADFNNDGVITTADIPIISTPDRVQFDFHLHRALTLVDQQIAFDLGLPALELEVDGAVRTLIGFDFDFGIGFSKTEGVYLRINEQDELSIHFDASIPNLSATARLALLQLNVKDDPTDPSHFSGSFAVDIRDPGTQAADGRLSLTELRSASPGDVINASLSAVADLNLTFVTSIAGSELLPTLRGEFNLDWVFDSADPAGGPASYGNAPNLAFNNVQFDAGGFISDLFGSTLGSIQQVLSPLRPITDVLSFQIPVLNVSLIDLAKRFGSSQVDFVAAVADVLSLVQNLPTFSDAIFVDIGSFSLGDLRGRASLDGVDPNVLSLGNPKTQLSTSNPQAAGFLNQAEQVTGSGFSFPILDNPSDLFGLLMGKDVELVRFDMAPLSVSLSKTIALPIFPPLTVELSGSASVALDFAFGFDTAGLRAGEDHLYGGGGNDELWGGGDSDRLEGQNGSDQSFGGSDILFGFAGDDRLFGHDGAMANSSDHDMLFAGVGNDDLLGGMGTNDLFAWSVDPRETNDIDADMQVQFGIFVGANGGLVDDDQNGTLPREDTGLNRIIGGPQADNLYGGTGLDFLFGGGGADTLYSADGATFENLDGALAGDAWKEYAKATDRVWYVGATNLDDVIAVDFVTEPGLLADRHIVTRLTNNNGNFTFDLQVRLDFDATDESDNLIWDPADLVVDLEALAAADPADRELIFNTLVLNGGLLPDEGEFLAIIIDALDGDDQVTVGPTVQSTVWIDAGAGDDRVEIQAGNAILIDSAERPTRNDGPNQAYNLVSAAATASAVGALAQGVQFSGLTIDNPSDVDWYRFALANPAAAQLALTSLADTDGLSLQVYGEAASGLDLADGTTIAPILAAPDEGELGPSPNNFLFNARSIDQFGSLARLTGATLHTASDVDYYRFALTDADLAGSPKMRLRSHSPGSSLSLELRSSTGALLAVAIEQEDGRLELDLTGLSAGQFVLRVAGQSAARYELLPVFAIAGTTVLDLSLETAPPLNLSSLTAGAPYWLEVTSPRIVPTVYDLNFVLPAGGAPLPEPIQLGIRTDAIRRDLILGGEGNDTLAGGPGEDFIFGGPGHDVLTGGQDRQASDLLFGQEGDDTFQIIPDGLPLVNGSDQTLIPMLSDELIGEDGDDRVLFLGGDLDAQGQPVPDHVTIRYNTVLHRYEVSALVWDVADNQFATIPAAPAVIRAAMPPDNFSVQSDQTFMLRVNGGPLVTLTLPASAGADRSLADLLDDLNGAMAAAGLAGDVIASQDDGRITFSTMRAGPTATVELDGLASLGFEGAAPLTATGRRNEFLQHFAYYTAGDDIERTVFDTRAGNDVVRADAGYKFLRPDGSENIDGSTWGLAEGDFQQGARIAALEIYGGAGSDILVGGPLADHIDGGPDRDFILGGLGDDDLVGGDGDDEIHGNFTPELPDRFEYVNSTGQSGRNDTAAFAAMLPGLSPDHPIAGTTLHALSIGSEDTGDWYILTTPYARAQFGGLQRTIVTADMVAVSDSGAPGAIFTLDLFAAQDIDPASGMQIVVVEEPVGVPEYYLLHVTGPSGPYSIHFTPEVGSAAHIPPGTADEVISGGLSDRGVVISLGDINNDGFDDLISSVDDHVGTGLDFIATIGTTLHPSDVIRATQARVYFGGAGGGSAGPNGVPVTLLLPAPLLSASIGGGISQIVTGDFNGDQIDDIAVNYINDHSDEDFPTPSGLGVYILFGTTDSSRWSGAIDVVAEADVYLRSDNFLAVGDVNADQIDDLLLYGDRNDVDSFDGFVGIYLGRNDWDQGLLFHEDFNNPASAGLIQNVTGLPGRIAGQWHRSMRRSGDVGHGGGASLYFGQEVSGNYDSGSATAGWITLPTVDLTDPALLGASLSFNYFLRTDGATDVARVLVSTDGGASYAPLAVTGGSASNTDKLLDPSSYWRRAAFELDAYLGQQIRVRLEFDTVDNLANHLEGWYVDDLAVRGIYHDVTRNSDIQITNDTASVGTAVVGGVGDFNGDSHEDFAIHVRGFPNLPTIFVLYGGAAQPLLAGGGVSALSVTGGLQIAIPDILVEGIRTAGNLNGGALGTFDDLIIQGIDGSYVVAGRSGLTGPVSLSAFDTIELVGTMRPVAAGDVNGDGIDDLAVERTLLSPRLNFSGGGMVSRQVGEVYFGATDFFPEDPADAPSPSLVFEQADPVHSLTEGFGALRPWMFGGVGHVAAAGGVVNDTRSDLAMAEFLTHHTRLYLGREALAAVAPAEPAPEPYSYDLAIPTAAPSPNVPGINPTDASAQITESFALLGVNPQEMLASSLDVGDVNGDGYRDLLLNGVGVSYLLLGPTMLDEIGSILDQAVIVLDTASLGTPFLRGGDVNADGLADLAFLSETTHPPFPEDFTVVRVLFGSEELPTHIDASYLTAANSRTVEIRQAFLTPENQSVHLLNYNGDVNPVTGIAYSDLLIVGSNAAPPGGASSTAFVISGADLPVNEALQGETRYIARIGVDSSPPMLFEEVLGFTPNNTARFYNLEVNVVGDVNGDGLEDMVFSWPFLSVINDPTVPPLAAGRAFLVLGRTEFFDVFEVDDDSALIVQDISFGYKIFALGDVNQDGLSDFAISRTREDNLTAPGALYVFYCSTEFDSDNPTSEKLSPEEAADLVVYHRSPGSLADGLSLISELSVTAGDFNGDGKQDLAVGVPSTIVTSGLETYKPLFNQVQPTPDPQYIIDTLQRGSTHVFFSVAEAAGPLYLDAADLVLAGAQPSDMLGTLPYSPRIDLNHDGLHDLVIGAAGVDSTLANPMSNAGGLYVIYGARGSGPLPGVDDFIELANFNVSGSGDFLVDRATGQAEVFHAQLAANQSEQWFRFSTLGDGRPGDHLVLSPASGLSLGPGGSPTLRMDAISTGSLIDGQVDPIEQFANRFAVEASGTDGIVEFDISSLLQYRDDPQALPATFLQFSLSDVPSISASNTLRVSLLDREGDGWLNPLDGLSTATNVFTLNHAALTVPGFSYFINIGDALLPALAAGWTRVTFRLELESPDMTGAIAINGGGNFRPGLVTFPQTDGLLADLHDAHGALLAQGQALFDMQHLTADSYYLRVYHPLFAPASPQPLSLSFVAPAIGHTHPLSDHDKIHGADGNDLVVGNDELDRLFGDGGVDLFIAETIELRDHTAGEIVFAPELGQFVHDAPFEPLDPVVHFADANLEAAVAQALRLTVTESHSGIPRAVRPMMSSDLARLFTLDLINQGIVDLSGLQLAVNLRELHLPWNHITDVSPLATLGNLELLTLDANAISDLSPLAGLTRLKALSLDYNPIVDIGPLSSLTALEHLSIEGRLSAELADSLPGGLAGGYGLLQELTNPVDSAASFGFALATMDNRVVVGAPSTPLLNDQGQLQNNAGTVYVYSALSGERLLAIDNPSPAQTELFGNAVATYDGKIVVGAPGARDPNVPVNPPTIGLVYVYNGSGDLLHTLRAPTPGSLFGTSVAVLGSVIAVGASDSVSGFSSAGAVYFFDAETGTFLRQVANPQPGTNDLFGSRIAPLDDDTLIVAAGNDDGNVGSVWLVDAFTGAAAKLPNPAPAFGSGMGFSVASIAGEVLAGAPGGGGAVFQFTSAGSLLSLLGNPEPPASSFGSGVAGIGTHAIAVGATGNDTGTTDAGAVFLYDYPNFAGTTKLANPIPSSADQFGRTITTLGDDLMLGAFGTDRGGVSNTGSTYIYGQFDTAGISDISALAGLTQLRWLSLASNDIDDVAPLASLSQLEFLHLHDNAIADLSPLAGQYLIDDGDEGFSSTGQWLNNTSPTDAAFGDDYQFTAGGDTSGNTATWQFEDLPDGTYNIQATWLAGGSRARQANYELDAGTSPTSVLVNQRFAHSGATFAGRSWQTLGSLEVTGGELVVRLSGSGDGSLAADALRLVKVGSLPAAQGLKHLTLQDNPLTGHSLDVVLPIIDGLADTVTVDANTSEPTLMPIATSYTSVSVPFAAALQYDDFDGDSVLLTAQSDTPSVEIIITPDGSGVLQLIVIPSSGFVGTARITVTAQDRAGGGRSVQQRFDLHIGTGGIHGTKWNDLDRDDVRDSGEPGLEGWTLYIDGNLNGLFDAGELFTLTDANGDYALDNLATQTHTVAEQAQPGWIAASSKNINLAPPILLVTGVSLGTFRVVNAGLDRIVNEGVFTAFNSVVSDPNPANGSNFTYQWQVVADNGQVVNPGSASSFAFTPRDNGTYIVALTVTDLDDGGMQYVDTVEVTALNRAPTVNLGLDRVVSEGASVLFSNPAMRLAIC